MEETATHAAIHLTSDTFKKEVQDFKGLVLVDFWAGWCVPCQVMAPRVEELATKYAGKANVKIAKLDVDANDEIAMNERVLSLPTFKLFKDGQVIDELIGAVPVEALDQLIMRNLAPAA